MLAASRRREGLADVSAVELTRNPLGLAGALRKIASDPEVLEVANKATQHLYIVNPIKAFEKRSSSMWDTHPPLAERIEVLESLARYQWRSRRGELTSAEGDRYPDPAPDGAEVAQLVEHRPEEAGVVSSNLTLGTNARAIRAEVAQLVEHHLAKVRVAGSSPVFRSISLPHGLC